MCLRETKPSVEEFKRKTPDALSVWIPLQYYKTGSSLIALNVVGISEGKESFTHHLIILVCDTQDYLDKSPQSIINNSCRVHQLIYALVTHLMLLH